MTKRTKEKPVYKRILLKLTGESLQGKVGYGVDFQVAQSIAQQIKDVKELGVSIACVIGGGNIFRGMKAADRGMDRVTADYIGMLATVINSMVLQDALESIGVQTRVQSAIKVDQLAEQFIRRRAVRHLEKERVVIFAGGTGNPFFTTDTAAALRGAEIGAEIVLKATKVDGVYTADPKKDSLATRYASITFDDAMRQNLGIMDAAAFALCRDQKLPIKVFSIFKHGALKRVVLGEDEGTLVHV